MCNKSARPDFCKYIDVGRLATSTGNDFFKTVINHLARQRHGGDRGEECFGSGALAYTKAVVWPFTKRRNFAHVHLPPAQNMCERNEWVHDLRPEKLICLDFYQKRTAF